MISQASQALMESLQTVASLRLNSPKDSGFAISEANTHCENSSLSDDHELFDEMPLRGFSLAFAWLKYNGNGVEVGAVGFDPHNFISTFKSVCVRCRQQTNAGALTNFEVIDLLRSRGASMDPTRIIGNIAPSELEVYDYLIESASCNQTRQNIGEFLKRCEKYHLAKAEKLNIINIRPFCDALINPVSYFFQSAFHIKNDCLLSMASR
ncbi:hypothetical protein GIB67_018281 [Kingdonia uniflora]|uniref:RNA polymerase Rpb4/RPC9 core domain-containing protein n=1 Tax=Kingdonia uniflora TaxID=39325 RepID=A0A7J7LET9_9MAGN|nr:hypothetical protein GIB67_018281 [Kingdonia uniflora]